MMNGSARIKTIKLISNSSHAMLNRVKRVKQIENPAIVMNQFHESQNKILLPLNISIIKLAANKHLIARLLFQFMYRTVQIYK